jgi:hypothetical protein
MLREQHHRGAKVKALSYPSGGSHRDHRLRAPIVIPKAMLGKPHRMEAHLLDLLRLCSKRGV